MTTQPEALRLAAMAHLGYRVGWQREAAAELRRLSAVNQELLEALKTIMNIDSFSALTEADVDAIDAQARAAIARAEGEKE
jgi:hypothetical protein